MTACNPSFFDITEHKNCDAGIPGDVRFKILDSDDQELGLVEAHKTFLAARSSVFKKQFFGHLKETEDPIPVKVCR